MDDYSEFIASKSQLDSYDGFAPITTSPWLYAFQRSLVDWSLRKGRSAIFADCGLGKTLIQLVWAENVIRHTNRPVLILAPLAVTSQTVREAEKFAIEARRSPDGVVHPGINVTNYERIHLFNPSDFAGVVCDESSILKSFDGVTKTNVTEFMRQCRYRLLCTATPSPNDTTELGTSSEALGYLGHMDMLSRFFKNDHNTASTGRKWAAHGGGQAKWRFKGHAEIPFWQFVASWARAVRHPSDLGFDDQGKFVLPALIERDHTVRSITPREGFLFAMPAHGLSEQREERKRTTTERCERAAALVADTKESAICWANTNREADLIESLVPGSIQVSGADSDESKEEKFAAFSSGESRVLVTKPVIGAWGMNWQHASHMTMFASYSFEQAYQCIRRCYRYGQTRPVTVDYVVSDGETEILANRQRKAAQAENMFRELIAHMQQATGIDFGKHIATKVQVPSWL